jgi:DME family drug/metabolite transporter
MGPSLYRPVWLDDISLAIMRAQMPEQPPVVIGPWLVISAAILWGTTGTAQAFAPPEATPLSVGSVRLAIGGLALLVLVSARTGFVFRGKWPLRPTLIAGVAIAVYQLFFFAGVARTGVAVGTIVGIGSAPVFAGLLDWLVRGERPGRRWFMATVLAMGGCSLLIVAGRQLNLDVLGVVLSMGAGFSYAVYALVSKELLAVQSPDRVMAVIFFLGALILMPVMLASDLTWLAQPRGLVVALHLGLITVAVAYLLFGRGLLVVPVATAVTLSLAEPLTAAALGVVVLGERLTTLAAVGIGLLLAGLALLAIGRRSRQK